MPAFSGAGAEEPADGEALVIRKRATKLLQQNTASQGERKEGYTYLGPTGLQCPRKLEGCLAAGCGGGTDGRCCAAAAAELLPVVSAAAADLATLAVALAAAAATVAVAMAPGAAATAAVLPAAPAVAPTTDAAAAMEALAAAIAVVVAVVAAAAADAVGDGHAPTMVAEAEPQH